MQGVIDYLSQNESRFVTELCDYVRFPSVSAQPQHRSDMQACAEWVVEQCRQIGLEARLCPTPGHPIVVARTPRAKAKGRRRPHFVVYGHYDVQPPEPLDLWKSPPFEPRVRNGALYGRGASDNKGQNLAHLKAVEAYLKTGTELPCDITFVIEGEEEVGSTSLASFLRAHRAELACDAIVISDTGMPSLKHPALTYGLRGIVAFEVTLHGPSRDLHSGIFGGTVDNPAMALCQLLGQLRDRNGRVTVPGFYDRVQPLSAYERKQFARLPFNARDYQKLVGVPTLFGERGFTAARTALRAADLRNQRPDERLPGRGQQDDCAGLGARQDHRAAGAKPGPGPGNGTYTATPGKAVPAHRATGVRIGPRRGALFGVAHRPAGAGGLARAEVGFRLRAGTGPGRRLDSHCQRVQEDSPRRRAHGGPGPARRQRALTEREI